ncbi:tetratricopeptide repeat-containing serine protease family protein [Crocosphaera sp.]|uniref:tetratricopeptide repeat-containing S1 family peptidase n=1 Tax=Crocosphaera sp. TaxID=2729996 RepID=UPI002611A054|nr:tetratricopeptide repeat-containing serine protease family protein [Crocosphaera sp.]MDJ0581445.1 tetratricopeptide repeat-containing serine protease family protein [Crocosphaera sp.]
MISWRSFLTSGLMLLILTGCQTISFNKSFNDIVEETKRSVVLISSGDKNKKGHGTGFFVKGDGRCAVLTADHVVRSSKQINITPYLDKRLFSTTSFKKIQNKDLALITFLVDGEENCPYTALKLNNFSQIEIFDTVAMVGYPTREGQATLVLQSSKGEITSIEDPPLPEGYAISYDMTTVGGMSGAPVINQWGEVIAVHGKTDVEIVSLGRNQQSSLSSEQKTKIDEISRRLQRINHFKWGIPIESYLAHQSSIITSILEDEAQALRLKEDAEILRLEGDRLRKNKQYTEAINSYDQALEIDPNDKDAWHGRGVALNELKRYEEAIKPYDKAIEIDPNYVKAWYNRGNALDELKRYEEAIKSYDKAIEIDPNYVKAWYNRGNSLRKLERYEEAIKSYDKAIEIDPNHVNAWNN